VNADAKYDSTDERPIASWHQMLISVHSLQCWSDDIHHEGINYASTGHNAVCYPKKKIYGVMCAQQ